MTYNYKTSGICAKGITVEMDGSVIRSVAFNGGCAGNLEGISRLVEGMRAEDVVAKFKGTKCGSKASSCPDQLARALEEAMARGA